MNIENAKKYLKGYTQLADTKIIKNEDKKEIGNRIKKKQKIEEDEDYDFGYNLDDIIRDCPKINIVRDFMKFQVDNIKDEDTNLFL